MACLAVRGAMPMKRYAKPIHSRAGMPGKPYESGAVAIEGSSEKEEDDYRRSLALVLRLL